MADSNPLRGDVVLHLNGKDYVLRPGFKAIMEIERDSGKGIMEIATRVMRREHGLMDAAIIVAAGMREGGEGGATAMKVAPMLMEAGLVQTIAPVVEYITNCLTGGEKDEPGEGEAKDPVPSI